MVDGSSGSFVGIVYGLCWRCVYVCVGLGCMEGGVVCEQLSVRSSNFMMVDLILGKLR